MEILKVGLSTPSVSWGDASILENRGNTDDDGILVNGDEKDDDGDYDEKQLRELGAGRPAPCLAGNQLISHHRGNQDNDDDNGDVDNGEYNVHKGRVAELGSLSSGAKMAMKIFVKRVFTIFASNASFLRIIANLQN